MRRRILIAFALASATALAAGCARGDDPSSDHTLRLSVSNQSFAVDSLPFIEVTIDGNLVLSGYLPVDQQLVWINTDVGLSSGSHELHAHCRYSLEGQGLVGDLQVSADVRFDLDGDRWARLSLIYDPEADETPRFEWVIASEPILLP